MSKKYWPLVFVIVISLILLKFRYNSQTVDIQEDNITYSNRDLRIYRELTDEERDQFISIISSNKNKYTYYPHQNKMTFSEDEYIQANETTFYFYDKHPFITIIMDGGEKTIEIDSESWVALKHLLEKLRKK